MPRLTEKIPVDMIRKARRVALPYCGKAILKDATGISYPTLRALLASGEARNEVIQKLEAGLAKLESEKSAA